MQKIKTKRKLKITQKAIKDQILTTCSPATAPEKGLVDGIYSC
jgi:hypothetical protein